MAPGLIVDLYMYARDYDDMMHGIKRDESVLMD